ncbi:hypothetical protein B0H34DRAFT_204696 [Crassisporium funariophilum]|nr:hypothetical protein B0H34DRAFT_204696 [Crassisporium funariophilum]
MPSQIIDQTRLNHDKSIEKKRIVAVSSSFFPGSHRWVSDTIFRSSDSVLFYVNLEVMLQASSNAFHRVLVGPLEEKLIGDVIIDIPESSVVLNIILHAMYGMSCARHSPTMEELETAVNRLPFYGITPKIHIVPSSPLFELLLSHAPLARLRLYVLAAHHDLYELAVRTSSHLLSLDLSDITDDIAKRMGPIYLKRLMCLHLTCLETLKAIILLPPHPHPTTRKCTFVEQKQLSRAWTLAASYLAWDSKPNLSIHSMQSTFGALGDHLVCEECKGVLNVRIQEVIVKWVKVKRTI